MIPDDIEVFFIEIKVNISHKPNRIKVDVKETNMKVFPTNERSLLNCVSYVLL